jgi:hypothetical protein
MTPSQRQLYEKAERERILVSNWILELMTQSRDKPATKNALREIAVKRFGVSKSSFDHGWNMAVWRTGHDSGKITFLLHMMRVRPYEADPDR